MLTLPYDLVVTFTLTHTNSMGTVSTRSTSLTISLEDLCVITSQDHFYPGGYKQFAIRDPNILTARGDYNFFDPEFTLTDCLVDQISYTKNVYVED